MPSLYIITGSNGAGKSSIGPEYIPFELKKLIFDGDLLFMKKKSELWSSGIRPHKECKKLAAKIVQDTFDGLVNISLTQNISFAYEGHFTNNATWDIQRNLKQLAMK